MSTTATIDSASASAEGADASSGNTLSNDVVMGEASTEPTTTNPSTTTTTTSSTDDDGTEIFLFTSNQLPRVIPINYVMLFPMPLLMHV